MMIAAASQGDWPKEGQSGGGGGGAAAAAAAVGAAVGRTMEGGTVGSEGWESGLQSQVPPSSISGLIHQTNSS